MERANVSAGSNYVRRAGESFLVRADARLKSIEDIQEAVVATRNGVPVRVKDVGQVMIGGAVRTGSGSRMGSEAVISTVLMLVGENSRIVATAVGEKLEQVNRTLPPDVFAEPVYNRSKLVNATIATVEKNLIEGALLVIVVLFLLLGNVRAALITAAVIPITMLMTASGMNALGVSGNLMSLGALDFGLIVDGAVIIVENALRHLAERQHAENRLLTLDERLETTAASAKEMIRPTVFGQLIIFLVFVPLLTFQGVEGKTFSPMATTLMIALACAFVLSLTFVPAMIVILIKGRVSETEVKPIRWFKERYAPLLGKVMRNTPVVLTGAAVAVVLSGLLATRMGSEFVPSLNEGDIAIQALRIPGTSLTQSLAMQQQLESKLMANHKEIARVFARTGTAEIASDPMPPNISDGYIMLKPRDAWPEPGKSRERLLAEIEATATSLPGNNYEFSQPIQLRFNELISGVRSDVAVKLFGDDMLVLDSTAAKIAGVLGKIPGATEVKVEQTTGLPMLTVQIDREQTARYGLNIADVQAAIATAIGGQEAGTLFQGDRRFDIVVRLPDSLRSDLEQLKRLPIALPLGAAAEGRARFIPLGEVASLQVAPGPNQISREDGKRRIVVSANVRGRDIGSFVADATQQLQAQVSIPAGYWTSWGGQFEQLQSATKRLELVVPVALALVFVLLFAMFGNVKDGLLVFSGIPFALTGGIVALWLRDIPMSISAAVGFIALSGVAVLNGLVMIAYIRQLREQGMPLQGAIREGAITRLRPVLMTALVASLGFVPMAIATGTGAEVQRPLATVVIGGILSSTALTLLVLPLLYRLAYRRQEEEEEEAGRIRSEGA